MGDKVAKLTPHTDGKKRRMFMTKLTAVALTARGANPEAHVTFFKINKSEASVEKRTVLASMEELHTHAVVIDDYAKLNKGGSTSWAGSSSESQHTHDYVIEDDGSVTIGVNEGHSHSVDKNVEQITKSGLSDEQITDSGLVLTFKKDESAANKGGNLSGNEDNTMTDAEKAAQKSADNLALLKTQLALAVLMGSMNDAQKAFHGKLDDDEKKKKFLAKSVEERQVIVDAAIELAKSNNAVVYKSHDGTEFFKSDDIRLVDMAKKGDIQAAQLLKAAEKTADQEVAKRATEVFKNMTGDAEVQTALLKSVDGIKDEEIRKQVMEMLAKSDAGIAALSEEHGHQHVSKGDNSKAEANIKLEGLAKAHSEKNPGVNAFDAYGIVSDANPELYKLAVG